jgi:hypothetical protein
MVVQLLFGSMIPDLGELLIAWALDLTLREGLLNELECVVHSMFALREEKQRGALLAREHADTVARELRFKNDSFLGEAWSDWSMVVHDGDGVEVFSFEMSDVRSGNGT